MTLTPPIYGVYTTVSETAADLESRLTAKQDALGLFVSTANGGGVVDASPQLAIDDAMATSLGQSLTVKPGTYRLGTNLTLSSGVVLPRGAMLKPANGVTAAMPARIHAGRYKVFDLSLGGAVTCWQTPELYPEWFGLVMNDAGAGVANDAAIKACIEAAADGTDFASVGGTIATANGNATFASNISVDRVVRIVASNGHGTTNFTFPDGTSGVTVEYYHTSPSGLGRGDGTTIEGLAVGAAGKLAGTGDGFFIKGRARLVNCTSTGFGRDNYHIEADTGATPATNANLWHLQECHGVAGGRHGLYVHGGDVNAGNAVACDFEDNGGWGILDDSFLGNTYTGCHTSGNASGPYSATGAAASNVFVNCYSEGGQPGSDIRVPSMVIGGAHGAGFAATSNAPWIRSGNLGLILPGAFIPNSKIPSTVTLSLGQGPTTDQGYFGFCAADDLAGAGGYAMKYGTSGAVGAGVGWYYYEHANAGGRWPLALGGENAVDVMGNSAWGTPMLPNGFYMGSGASMRRVGFAAAVPTTGKWAQGDKVFNTAPVAGGTIGWVCTTSGDFAATPPVFKTFGTIAA